MNVSLNRTDVLSNEFFCKTHDKGGFCFLQSMNEVCGKEGSKIFQASKGGMEKKRKPAQLLSSSCHFEFLLLLFDCFYLPPEFAKW